MALTFEALFSPFLSLQLSAFENAKLVAAVLNDANEQWQVFEVNCAEGSSPYYMVNWQQQWIICGKINDYNVSIKLAEAIDITSKKQLTVPVLNMQQVSFMCMENSHFDHC
ncbi:hypothetical protein ACFOD0_15065 [Shewanella intestini]|uniref:Uncharacterized protein n=1 Tax=Shewanella intestini TaxID=2017544 RepID=A0ABS5I5V2_9GAMM|nr:MULTISPECIES: hypothetical protein [Shewanella]MBR9729403.1 hypothetical protein [Shewanella intestini]MRG37483.1 hypothetical protein [Shewanella sp. XMDDZSB0408]